MIDDEPAGESPETIREFWFASHADDAAAAAAQARLWWRKSAKTDALVRQRFEKWVMHAAAGALDAWLASAAGRLALILLTDQFPRNMYRNTSKAFAFDWRALAWCHAGLARHDDAALRPLERVFFYLPLEHSENLADQRRSVALFTALADSVAPTHRPVFDGYLDFAVRHHDIIERFGRFPHRNRILGRSSTPAEIAFLSEKGASF